MNPAQLLAHPEVAKAICGTLRATGTRKHDVQDGLQEVYARALRFFRLKPAAAPTELANMKSFCAQVARNYALDQYRKWKRRKTDLEAHCDRAEYGVVERPSVPRRDPVDAGRQLEVLAELFREGRMPEHGVDILEGVACGCTFKQVAEAVGINEELAKWRMREMKRIYRSRMAKLGLLSGTKPLRVVISNPSAIPLLRQAA
jgi:DNA-directed RNA polymerase specialized sigma24 family protein